MEIKEPELSNVIQNASHRIYNEMLRNVEYYNDNEIPDIEKEKNKMSKEEFITVIPNYNSPRVNGFDKNGKNLSDLSSDDLWKKDPYYKLHRPPPLNPCQIADEGQQLQHKNAICSLDLSEGEAAASKLQDLRLIKGISKSLANNLNDAFHPTSNEEYSLSSLSYVNSTSPGELRNGIPNSTIGILLPY